MLSNHDKTFGGNTCQTLSTQYNTRGTTLSLPFSGQAQRKTNTAIRRKHPFVFAMGFSEFSLVTDEGS